MWLRQEIAVKRPEWTRRHGNLILLHDNARPHIAQSVKDSLRDFTSFQRIITSSGRWHKGWLTNASRIVRVNKNRTSPGRHGVVAKDVATATPGNHFCEVWFLPESVVRVTYIIGDNRCNTPRH
ncbi:hypothetical protein LAZ67_22000534 [Cordylochernes scorpioides]|uniref:Transposase n=1 Tax=Cordylochernes scorpioides TaxID=51811 RepID=A0ABY6LRA7_9ARAC|nr:hypothetical protein LAZ67_22000534 [Cordylochernes scorpioides]